VQNVKTDPALDSRFEERCQALGARLEEVIRPLVEKPAGQEEENRRAERFKQYCQDFTRRVIDNLDLKRDLNESRILVLDNGMGTLARRLAEGKTDVVSASPTEATARLAAALNPYPSIIYRTLGQKLLDERFDLIIDTGILSYFPREIMEYLVPRLAGSCRRKLILEFRIRRPWLTSLFDRNDRYHDFRLTLGQTFYDEDESVSLIETVCGMLITERRTEGSSLLVKALRKPHTS
jgi:hypothetical protein